MGLIVKSRRPTLAPEQPSADAKELIAPIREQKPAWWKLQWANAERERLEKEVARLQQEMENLKAAQAKPSFISVCIVSLTVDDKTVPRGKTLKIRYDVDSSEDVLDGVWLGASLWDKDGKHFSNVLQDKSVALYKGARQYDRDLTIPVAALPGSYRLGANVWYGPRGNSNDSRIMARGGRIDITVVA
jgi:hypothetical protein